MKSRSRPPPPHPVRALAPARPPSRRDGVASRVTDQSRRARGSLGPSSLLLPADLSPVVAASELISDHFSLAVHLDLIAPHHVRRRWHPFELDHLHTDQPPVIRAGHGRDRFRF